MNINDDLFKQIRRDIKRLDRYQKINFSHRVRCVYSDCPHIGAINMYEMIYHALVYKCKVDLT